jgi:hypothetical protein
MTMRSALLFVGAAAAQASSLSYGWLLNKTVALLNECQEVGVNGTHIFTPDGVNAYGAQWTRDFAYMISGAPDALALTGTSVRDAVAYTFARVTPEGMVPDRVQANGAAVFGPGVGWPIALAWDNHPFLGLMLSSYASGFADDDTFCSLEPTARAALQFVPLLDGLAFNDPAAPNCSYGFIDTVVLHNRTLFVSLLMFDAASQLAALAARTGCGDIAYYRSLASTIAANVDSLYDEASGLFLACDGSVNSLPDVWGSLYLTYLGLSNESRRQAVAAYVAEQFLTGTPGASIFQEGQLRHLPFGTFWQQCFPSGACPTQGTYQNGAFWATPLSWTVPALAENGQAEAAAGIVNATVLSFQTSGVMEAINRNISYTGVADYLASATNVLSVLRYWETRGRHLLR